MFNNIRFFNGKTLMSCDSLSSGFEYEIDWQYGYITIGNAYISGYSPQKLF